MKLTILLAALVSTQVAMSATTDYECVGDLTKNDYSRRTHLEYNEETEELEGYKGTLETGGVLFTAKESGDVMIFKMTRNTVAGDEVVAQASLPVDSNLLLTVSLEEGFEASLLCYKRE